MLTEEQLKILDLFRKDLFKEYTIRELAKRINKTSYSWTFNVVKNLYKLGILNLVKKGKANLCSINLDNNLTITYLSLLDQLNSYNKKIPWKNINKLLDLIDTPYFTFLITGSYAAGKQTSKSDLDVVIILDNVADIKNTTNKLKNEGELMIPEVHPYVFTKSQFLEMLTNDELNYGKLVFQKHLIIFGASNYYKIIKEAIKNGFRG